VVESGDLKLTVLSATRDTHCSFDVPLGCRYPKEAFGRGAKGKAQTNSQSRAWPSALCLGLNMIEQKKPRQWALYKQDKSFIGFELINGGCIVEYRGDLPKFQCNVIELEAYLALETENKILKLQLESAQKLNGEKSEKEQNCFSDKDKISELVKELEYASILARLWLHKYERDLKK
jgi:hypothetical protein